MAVQYAFVGIAQTRKAKDKVTMENSNPHEEDGQAPVFLLEAMPIVAESNVNESICDAEVVEEIAEKTIATDSKVISEEVSPDNEQSTVPTTPASSTYQQGIDDFYQSQAASQKKKLDTIHEYLLYIHHVPFYLRGRHGRVLYRPVEIRDGSQLTPWGWVEEIQDKAEQLPCPPSGLEHCHKIRTRQR